MPCKIFLAGDSDPIWLEDSADVVLSTVETAIAEGVSFVRLDQVPHTRQDASRPAYFKPGAVNAILPVPPAEYDHLLDDPPPWMTE